MANETHNSNVRTNLIKGQLNQTKAKEMAEDLGNNKLEEKYDVSWNKLFSNVLFHLRKNPDPYIEEVIQDLEKRHILNIASVPCGDFINEEELAKNGFGIDGYDISEVALELARKRAKKSKLLKHDILKNRLPKKYDAIIVLDLSMHLTDGSLLRFLNNIHESLNFSGVVYINFLGLEDDTAKTSKLDFQNTVIYSESRILMKYRTKKEIEDLINKTCFSVLKMSPYERVDEPHRGLAGSKRNIHIEDIF